MSLNGLWKLLERPEVGTASVQVTVICSLLPLVYIFAPYAIIRTIEGLVILILPCDFTDFANNPDKKELYLLRRFSIETIEKIKANPRKCGAVIGFESLFAVVILLLTPWFLQLRFVWYVPVAVILAALLFHLPYGRCWRPRSRVSSSGS